MSATEKLSLTPDELAHALLSRAVEDSSSVLATHNERFRSSSTFQPNRFERRKFLYLVADFALALTAAAQQQPAMAEVVPHFRQKVLIMMEKYWGDTDAEADEDLEKASANYAKLIFTNPAENDGFSYDWAQGWLRAAGIDETNPAVLLSVASTWRLFHAHTLNSFSAIHIKT